MGIVHFDDEDQGKGGGDGMLTVPVHRPARRSLSGRRGSEVQAQFVLKMYEEAKANEPLSKPNDNSNTEEG